MHALAHTLLLASPAAADDAAVAAAFGTAMGEFRAILTCSALIPDHAARLPGLWQENVAETLAVIAAAGARPENPAAFAASALPGGLMPAPDAPWSEMQEYCRPNPDWHGRIQRFEFTALPSAVEEARAT